ncbi:MAG: IS1595 family transposase [Hydrotalea sp. AMD]|uniref:IS1595 family transposase n=1 Tax=Hydrotalea sp. AMD TaxID=2501297 RepID=UPI0009429119|nr:IS1595 family transposase [Hydrotalea sp. AMD]RTL47559.1 MAG: IS1595 family transposase [Sphingobacteriales bacterium]RWZ88108.1 MAG: IS1595 family transposase [Hydrotalea sp. AMD]
MFKGINAIEFSKRFNTNEDCYNYLLKIKWGKDYQCSRCGCKESYKGRTYYYRRCRDCSYDASVTANTVFHGIKMPILKAFHMVFRLTAKKKGMSTIELGTEVGVQQKTAWLFKRKVQAVMKKDKDDKLNGDVEVDESLIGGYSSAKGRSTETKDAMFVAVEILPDGRTGNLALQHIESFKSDELKYAIKDNVSETAQIKTDAFHSYKKLSKEMSNITISYSAKGGAMEQLHKQIMQFKNWLRGTHHQCSSEYLFAYTDEYEYRFNKRNVRKWLFNDVVVRLMNQIPHPYN